MTTHATPTPLPSLTRLTEGLTAALDAAHGGVLPVSVVERRTQTCQSTFATEVVTCQIGNRRRRLFCKYSKPDAETTAHRAFRHRNGVTFEADVYERILRPLGVSVPALRGVWRNAASHDTWLLLQYLDRSVRLHKAPARMADTAEWIGRFHALSECRLHTPEYAFLRRYDAAYYRGWARRVLRSAHRYHLGGRWLTRVIEGFEDTILDLLAAPQTVIHGEYYPANILVQNRRVRPVDWETAAVACGEIDLACLTEGWSRRVSRECERAYRAARWPHGAPKGFQRRLQAARFYVLLRWAGEPSAWYARDGRDYYTEQLRATGERLGWC